MKFTVENEPERLNLSDGDYIAVILNVEEKMDKYGTYIQVEEEFLDPPEVNGYNNFERFYTGAYDEEKQKWGKIFFSRLCKQLLGVSGSSDIDTDDLIGKRFIKTIKNTIGKNGNSYQNTTNRVLIKDNSSLSTTISANSSLSIPEATVLYGNIAIPNKSEPGNADPLNDEVPF